jgi:hypothetical protein
MEMGGLVPWPVNLGVPKVRMTRYGYGTPSTAHALLEISNHHSISY